LSWFFRGALADSNGTYTFKGFYEPKTEKENEKIPKNDYFINFCG